MSCITQQSKVIDPDVFIILVKHVPPDLEKWCISVQEQEQETKLKQFMMYVTWYYGYFIISGTRNIIT